MQETYQTQRLQLRPLRAGDEPFILELLNTEGWIRFIGDRNLKTIEDAALYIEKIMANTDIRYWVVNTNQSLKSAGIITVIKRSYLDHHDIGFAFLPAFSGRGNAFEAAETILGDLLKQPAHHAILATTLPDNRRSIGLLEKLGFRFEREIDVEQKKLFLYSITAC